MKRDFAKNENTKKFYMSESRWSEALKRIFKRENNFIVDRESDEMREYIMRCFIADRKSNKMKEYIVTAITKTLRFDFLSFFAYSIDSDNVK